MNDFTADPQNPTPRDQLRQLMKERQRAYSEVFGNQNAANKLVLEDLKRFCRFSASTFHVEPAIHALLEGRREVILRIDDYCNMSIDELCNKYGRKDVNASPQ